MTRDNIHELRLHSTSRAADGAYLAAIDVAEVAHENDMEYRIVGGNAVTLLTVVHHVDHLVPGRVTADADFGAPFPVVADPRLPAGLAARGYDRVEGNRFQRIRPDGEMELVLVVDVLAPAYEYRLKPNQRHGNLVVDEVPGLPLALARPPTTVHRHFATPRASGTRDATNSRPQQARLRALALQVIRPEPITP